MNRYFDRKQQNEKDAQSKPNATPRINKPSSVKPATEQDSNDLESVEARLLRKGEEYKHKKVQKLHLMGQDEAVNGPQYKPQLVSKNEKYLPENNQPRHAKFQTEVGMDQRMPDNISTHEDLYFGGMIGLFYK